MPAGAFRLAGPDKSSQAGLGAQSKQNEQNHCDQDADLEGHGVAFHDVVRRPFSMLACLLLQKTWCANSFGFPVGENAGDSDD